ncbi:MAG: 2-amino-4-hydroxy-6-hydroxymethyldihydropteridine diphosphokinase [Elusimicrobiota bacterium]
MVKAESSKSVDVYIGVGANAGNRKKNIFSALELLNMEKDVEIKKCSSIRETPPWGYKNQPKFLNAVWKIRTDVPPEKLLRLLKKIEKRLGRKKTFRWGPRVIDLDILLYGKRVIKTKTLKIPHPHLSERDSVLKPLKEIEPGIKIPS